MEVIDIKNVSVQPKVGPAVAMRIVDASTNEELIGLQDGDVVNAKGIKTMLDNIESTPGARGPQGPAGPTGPMPTLVNDLLSTSPSMALAAAQGKILKDLIAALTARVVTLEAKA